MKTNGATTDEILKALLLEALNHTHFAATPQETFNMFYDSDSYKKALTAIYEIGLGVIGADITPVQGKRYVDQYYFENKLKASQRKAWAKACGVAEK